MSGGFFALWDFGTSGETLGREPDKKRRLLIIRDDQPQAKVVEQALGNLSTKEQELIKEEVIRTKKEHRKAELLPRISAHNLRHTACINTAKYGMNIKVLQYLMGHAHSDVAMDVYNHIAGRHEAFCQVNF